MVVATILIFLGMLLALVLVHEWGHFIIAKKAGCKVEEFGFGFPPRLFSKMWRGTLYSFNLLPLGGFVKIEGENMDEETPSSTSFASKSALWRIAILSAGVIMNLVLAAVLLAFESGIGAPTIATPENRGTLTNIMTYVLDISPNSPAAQAHMQPYDRIVRYADIEKPTVAQIQELTKQLAGTEITAEIERAGQHMQISITPRVNPPEGEGALGIGLGETGLLKTSWLMAPVEGVKRTAFMSGAIVDQFAGLIQKLFRKESVGQVLTGPIGIAIYTKEAASLGLSYFLEFAAMISINLAIINILPLPALDGGRILFVIIEKLFGKRVPGNIESYVHTAGFVLLIGLMIAITFKDVHRYF
ncbi:MAG TPA: RIP metalloprotease RseP [Candidatus Andersenbacteria bacterium]|nr:RIP metalloprotease RseP [Candidatus Andersenbacteria bacterium]